MSKDIRHNNSVSYDDFGETFGRSRHGLRWPEIDKILDIIMNTPRMTGRIADIGCGNGRLLDHIVQSQHADFFLNHMTEYVGLDMSRVLLAQAQGREWNMPVHFCLGDMRDMDQHLSGYFDSICFVASFHHLEYEDERITVLQKSKKLLSKDGKISMLNWHLLNLPQYADSQTLQYSNESADYGIKIGEHTRFYHAFSIKEYEDLAEKVGMNITIIPSENNVLTIWS